MSIFYAGIARGQDILAEYNVDGTDMNDLVSLILEKAVLNEETKLTYVYKMYMIHYIYTPVDSVGGLTYLCITSDQIERRVPFALLYEIKREFAKYFSLHDMIELPVSSFVGFSREIAEKISMMGRDDGMLMTDMVRVVQKEMEQVKSAMTENIEKVLERGERIELLVNRTQNMNETAFSFSKRSSYLRRRIWWESVKMTVIFCFVALFLLYLLIGFGCGFPAWQSCQFISIS
ncbi:unnamed protein product [Pneumocystis jirovecii]|uniref:Synaptobrevin homolog YKT6 n=1 Tax=Pneumocystis jirovecii TaxID=42068 RepID=L0PCZ0_PNEJI|nr:unnamed protein product [Pneumocystis jirovecii]